MKPSLAAASIFSVFAFKEEIIGIKTSKQAFTVSTASKNASLSSCRSLLYARGKPFNTVSIAMRSP